MTLPIYIVSKGYVPRMHLLTWLRQPCTVVTHYKDNARDIKKAFPYVKVVTTNMDGLANSRNMVSDICKKNAFYIGMDDNIEKFTTVDRRVWKLPKVNMMEQQPPKPYKTWRHAYRLPLSHVPSLVNVQGLSRLLMLALQQNDTVYGGVASQENPFFRQAKWSSVRFVKSKFFVMQNTREFQWQGEVSHDSRMSVEVVAHRGCVAVCNYVHAFHQWYGPGGLGTVTERRPLLNIELAKIVDEYAGLCGIAKGANSALRFLRSTKKAVANWQNETND